MMTKTATHAGRFVGAPEDVVFVKAALQEAKDASGHEHKGKGEGGGQFVKGGGGGGGGGDNATADSSQYKMSFPRDEAKTTKHIQALTGGKTPQEAVTLSGAPPGSHVRTVPNDMAGKNGVSWVVSEGEVVLLVHAGQEGKKKFIFNSEIIIDDSAQGKGLGTGLIERQVEAASRMGFDEIRLTGAAPEHGTEYNGYYTWPRLGFDASLSSVNGLPLRPPEFAKAKNVSDLMTTPEGRKWWKENGRGVSLKFDLKPGSRSRQVLEAYLKERANR